MNKKKIIITGGEGFIGAHLTKKCIDLGYEVYVIDNESAICNEQFIKHDGAKYYKADIVDELYQIDYHIFKDADVIFHLAAESRIGPAIENPIHTAQVNIMGTLNLLEIARKFNVKKFIYSSTSSVYGVTSRLPTSETSAIDCLNPYSATKYAGEELVKMYNKLYGLNTCIFRYFNVYGEGSPTKGQYSPVVGIFLKQFKNGQRLTITGDGLKRRDFVHVDDIVKANLLAYEYPDSLNGEIFNVGSGINYSILEIAKIFRRDIDFSPPRQAEAEHTLADISKIRICLGFIPSIDAQDWIYDQIKK